MFQGITGFRGVPLVFENSAVFRRFYGMSRGIPGLLMTVLSDFREFHGYSVNLGRFRGHNRTFQGFQEHFETV